MRSDWSRGVFAWVYKDGCRVNMFCFAPGNHAIYEHIFSSAESWKIFRNIMCQFFYLS